MPIAGVNKDNIRESGTLLRLQASRRKTFRQTGEKYMKYIFSLKFHLHNGSNYDNIVIHKKIY